MPQLTEVPNSNWNTWLAAWFCLSIPYSAVSDPTGQHSEIKSRLQTAFSRIQLSSYTIIQGNFRQLGLVLKLGLSTSNAKFIMQIQLQRH